MATECSTCNKSLSRLTLPPLWHHHQPERFQRRDRDRCVRDIFDDDHAPTFRVEHGDGAQVVAVDHRHIDVNRPANGLKDQVQRLANRDDIMQAGNFHPAKCAEK